MAIITFRSNQASKMFNKTNGSLFWLKARTNKWSSIHFKCFLWLKHDQSNGQILMFERCFCVCWPEELPWTPHWAESQLTHPHLWLFWRLVLQIAVHILKERRKKKTKHKLKLTLSFKTVHSISVALRADWKKNKQKLKEIEDKKKRYY